MALREIDDEGNCYAITRLPYEREFDRVWNLMHPDEQRAIQDEINGRLDDMAVDPQGGGGSITNTSIEGGRTSPVTGVAGDWTGTPYEPIYNACGCSEDQAGMFLGNVWKKFIIEHPSKWVGIRFDPTFPQRGITLAGKTYFLDKT